MDVCSYGQDIRTIIRFAPVYEVIAFIGCEMGKEGKAVGNNCWGCVYSFLGVKINVTP